MNKKQQLSQIDLSEFIGEIWESEKETKMDTRTTQIKQARKQSLSQATNLIFETKIDRIEYGHHVQKDHREFFRYENGELEEYDCTSYYGIPIRLFKEEADIINEMNYQEVNDDNEVFVANNR